MTTNKEFLYSLDPHALTEWFESEREYMRSYEAASDRVVDELQSQVDSLRSDLHAARSDAEYYRGKLGDVLDCVCEALRVGTLDVSVVDRDGEVVS